MAERTPMIAITITKSTKLKPSDGRSSCLTGGQLSNGIARLLSKFADSRQAVGLPLVRLGNTDLEAPRCLLACATLEQRMTFLKCSKNEECGVSGA